MKKIYLFILLICFTFSAFTQTTLISPTSDGGFETGTTIAANGWVAVNPSSTALDNWVVGAAPAASAGARCAYVSTTNGTTWVYSTLNSVEHLYKTITVPANETILKLSFKWKVGGEGASDVDNDNMKIFLVPSTVVPTVNNTVASNYQIYGGTSVFGMYKLSSTNYNAETINFSVTAGATYKLVFSWKSNPITIANPPAAIDEISLTSVSPNNIYSTPIGGLWSSPASWVGGIVPNAENAIIADGAIITIDQPVTVNDLTVGEGNSGVLQWNSVRNNINALGNVMVNNGANFNLFTAEASPRGVLVNVGNNFTNNGTVHAGYSTSGFNAGIFFIGVNSNPILAGSGTFVNGIISALFYRTNGNASINTSQNITTRILTQASGTLNTNNKLEINNTVQIFGETFNQKIYEIVVTNMGSGYNTSNPPTISIDAPAGAGITATAIPNIDNATGTLRSITITNAGDGYKTNPIITITGGLGSGCIATAIVNIVSPGVINANGAINGPATVIGSINIKSDQTIGSISTSYGGVGYVTAPDVGASLPSGGLNLVTNTGSGYTSLPTVTVVGGVKLTGGLDPEFAVVVAQGKVVSVITSITGTLWQVQPTLVISGGGGTGATCAYPPNCLVTAIATIRYGAVNNFTITNTGSGYLSAPNIGLVGGGFTTPASTPASTVGLYHLNLGRSTPVINDIQVQHLESAFMPANRKLYRLTINNTLGASFTNDVELYGNGPLDLIEGTLNMGNNTLYASFPYYTGFGGSTTSSVSGTIKLSTPGGSVIRNFAFDATMSVATGSGSLNNGSTITTLTATKTSAPSGLVFPAGYPTGLRAYRLQTNAGAVYGNTPQVTLNYNANDGIISDNASLTIAQSDALTGIWFVRSGISGAGILPATGSRTTSTSSPGPIVPTNDDYYAWTSTFANIVSIASGDWNNPAIWNIGRVPLCTDNVLINNAHNVTVTTTGMVSKSLIIQNGGTLSLSGGDATVGCSLNNNSLTNYGTLNVSNGILNINGSLAITMGSKFIQSGGEINVDGNAAGNISNSVAAGTFIVSILGGTASDINLSGGVFTIVDPHAAGAGTFNAALNEIGSIITPATHTFRFGDGISTDNGTSQGFECYAYNGLGIFTFGTVKLETVTGGINRFVYLQNTRSAFSTNGDLIINSGAEMRQANTSVIGAVFLGKNLIVNTGAIITLPGFLTCARIASLSASSTRISAVNEPQSIGGAGIFRNAVVSATANSGSLYISNINTTGVTLLVPLVLSTQLQMSNGVINTSATNLLTLGYNTANVGTLSYNNGRINGPFKRWIGASTGTRQFPVGNSTNIFNADINFTTAPTTGGTLTAQWINGDPGFPNVTQLIEPVGNLNINKVVAAGQWQIDAGDGLAGGNYSGTFKPTGPSLNIIDYTKTVLVKRPSSGGDWSLDGTHTITTGSNITPILLRTGMSGFSQFAIGGESITVLPIFIEFFNGSKIAGVNYLDWKVICTNTPSILLTLERSADGRNFTAIEEQNATAIRCLQSFNYTDTNPLSGYNYYRLKTISTDGKITYSTIIVLLNKEKGFELISLAPNPVKNTSVLSLTTVKGGKVDINVADISGKIILKESVIVIAGNNTINLNFATLSTGKYIISAANGDGELKTIQFIKL
jgi:hypothetical protein